MKIRDLFEHHGVIGNPFAEEDAQNDTVFKSSCIKTSFHSSWDKIYGNPAEPSSSIVFGEKGSGKTALRIQMIRMLTEYNTDNPEKRPLVIDYSDLNPFIDRFRHRFSANRKIQKVLAKWELWDHLDAVLSLGTTQLVDRILAPGAVPHPAAVDNISSKTQSLPVSELNEQQVSDLLLLAMCYDVPNTVNIVPRWKKLAKKIHYRTWASLFQNHWESSLGIAATLLITFIAHHWAGGLGFLGSRWFYILLFISWLPLILKASQRFWKAFKLKHSLRVLPHLKANLFKELMSLRKADFSGMSFPVRGNTANRYEMLSKFLGVCGTLGFDGLIVIMDRVDEPYLINGSPELEKLIIWSLFDNKLLKYSRTGFKLLLPGELLYFIDHEDSEFRQRARLDKMNLVRSLDWTGESLFDLVNVRLRACAMDGKTPDITDFFEPSIDKKRLINAFAKLKVPRHLFKFLYGVFGQHVNNHTDTEPVWKISEGTFEAALALYLRNRDASERNLGVV
jgi:hypothetical protein